MRRIVTVVVAFGSGLFLFLAVHRPVKVLMEGTRQISSGNLEHQIEVSSQDELGQLAHSFNEMTRILAKVETENRTWSETLEKRVEEKTAELKQVHQQILQIEKMASLGKLSATVAHELNNPLEGILTYGKLIAKRLRRIENPAGADQTTLEDMDLIVHEVQRCGNIVKNLLLFSKKQVGEIGLVQVGVVVNRAVQLMQHHFKISNVRFEQSLDAQDMTLMCDENQIQQALVALFVNAVEAMPNGGTLRLQHRRVRHRASSRCACRTPAAGLRPKTSSTFSNRFSPPRKRARAWGSGSPSCSALSTVTAGTSPFSPNRGRAPPSRLVFPPAGNAPPPGGTSGRIRIPGFGMNQGSP